MATVSDINVSIGADIRAFQQNMKKVQRQLQRKVRRFQQIGNTLTNSFTLPFAAITVSGAKMASDLESSFGKIENLVGITGDTLDEFKAGVRQLSGEVGKSQKELADALFTITSAGIKGKDAINILTQASKASVVGLGDTTEIARVTTAVIQAYGKENINAAAAVDKLTAIVKAGNLEASELAPTLGAVLPVASALGVSFDEVGANIAAFTRLGVNSAEASTAIKSTLSAILKPSEGASKAMNQLGFSASALRDKLKHDGLAETLQFLIEKTNGNSAAMGKLFPNIKALSNVLGTAGAQGKEYAKIVDQITSSTGLVDKAFEKASQSSAQQFKTALVNLQNAGIELGKIILPFATALAKRISAVVSAFTALDSGTKKVILAVGGFVAAIGPAYKVLALYNQAGIAARNMLIGYSNIVGKAIVKVRALNLAQKASLIGLAVAGVVAAVVAYNNYANSLTAAEKAQKSLTEVSIVAKQNIAAEKIEAEQLVSVIDSNTTSLEEKQKALENLKAINSTYFGGLKFEKGEIKDINIALENYIANIEKRAKVTAAQEKLVEIEKKLLDTTQMLEDAEPTWLQTAGNALFRFGDSSSFATRQLIAQTKNLADNKKALELQKQAMLDVISTSDILNSSARKSVDTSSPTPLDISSTYTEKKQIVNEKVDVAPLLEYKNTIQEIAINGNLATESVQNMASAMTLGLEELTPVVETFAEKLRAVSEEYGAIGEVANVSAMAMIDAANQGASSLADLGNAALDAAKDFIRAQIMQAVIGYASKALATLGPIGVPIAAAAGAVVGGIFNMLTSNIQIPALAEGGLAHAPTLALVGDNPNARVDPEVISPLSKLKKIIGNQGGQDIHVTIDSRIRGNDLDQVIKAVRFGNRRIK